jgi:glycosyltransferase involved in cell wall biosynthesis
LEEPKNPRLLLEAFQLVLKRMRAELHIVGDGSLRRELEELVRDLGIDHFVSFLGFQRDPYESMLNANLLVLTSNSEGLPSALVEGLYCGLPVVSTDSGAGAREILLDGHHGSLVPCNDKLALAEAIERELNQPRSADQQRVGAARYSPKRAADAFLRLVDAERR